VTTRGWQLLVEWKDGSYSWAGLKDMKDSNPIETTEYAVAQAIDNEPAFKWWVRDVLQRRNRIVAPIKNKYWRTTHKYGVKLPHTPRRRYGWMPRTVATIGSGQSTKN
jgi:hypothetical protein